MKASAETRLRRVDGKLKMATFARSFRRLFQVVAVLFLVCKLCDSVVFQWLCGVRENIPTEAISENNKPT